MSFSYLRRVNFYETDLMGIVHHANYLRFCEEARVAWLRERKLSHLHGRGKACLFAVLATQVEHLRPLYYEDEMQVNLQVKIEGVRIEYFYKILNLTKNEVAATARTFHVTVNDDMKVIKPPKPILEVMKGEPWIET